MKGSVLSLLFVCYALGAASLSPSGYLSASDKARLESVFASHLRDDSKPKTLSALFHAAMGLKAAGGGVVNKDAACKELETRLKDPKNGINKLYMAMAGGKALDCGFQLSKEARELVTQSLKADAPVSSIYHGVMISVLLGLPVDANAVSTALTAGLKKDDSITNLGYAFHAAAATPGFTAAQYKPLFERIEDAIVQADEIDGKILQFESGIGTTNLVVTGALKLAAKVGKDPQLSKSQLIKFANYFIGRKNARGVKAAHQALDAINVLSDTHFTPVSITLASQSVVSESSPKIRVKVTDLLGRPVKNAKFTVSIDGKIAPKAKMTPVPEDPESTFEIDVKAGNLERGFYDLTVDAVPQKTDGKLVGNTGAVLKVKVATVVTVEKAEIAVEDADQSAAPKFSALQHPKKLPAALSAGTRHTIVLKFSLKEKTASKNVFKPHQTFVRIYNAASEIIFVAEPVDSKSSDYKFQLDVGAKAEEFGGKSGKYSVELAIGDALLSETIVWTLCDLDLSFPESETPVIPSTGIRKPEIKHVFRTPELRPPTAVSNAFTVLCLAPILIMFGIWSKIGVNLSSFPFSLSAVGFHFGLAAIFGLYYLFWVQLNMFATVKYLVLIGIVTFLCGNSMLVKIAEKRKQT